MKNFIQDGKTLTLTPAAAVASGVGYLFGTALFGVATNDVVISTPGEFVTEGVVQIAKTASLAIAVGDRLFWDATNKCVNKTATAQQCVGIAVEATDNAAGTVLVKMKLGNNVPVATESMSFADLQSRINAAAVSRFSNATASDPDRRADSAFGIGEVSGMFDNVYLSELGMSGSGPSFRGLSSDLAAVKRGTAVSINNLDQYTVSGIEPDGTGMTRLRLQEV